MLVRRRLMAKVLHLLLAFHERRIFDCIKYHVLTREAQPDPVGRARSGVEAARPLEEQIP